MDKIEKALKVKDILGRLLSRDTANINIKKLKGRTDIFRVRKGAIRITYRQTDESIAILTIERRSDTTYK